MNNRPAIPTGDYLLYHDGRYASYGPRVVDREGNVGPPDEGQEPDFWSAYTRDKAGIGWQWYADAPTRKLVHLAAEAALAAVMQ